MNKVKKLIIINSLSNYGVNDVHFDNEYVKDVFGNLILYSIDNGRVTIHNGSLDSINEDFECYIGDLCYCIYNSYREGQYEPTYIVREREINNVKEEYKEGSKKGYWKRHKERNWEVGKLPLWFERA